MLRIVTDGGADMPVGWDKQFDFNIIPIIVRFGDEVYTQGVDIDQESFYKLIAEKKVVPKTSLPSVQQIINFYRGISQKGDEILSIHISSRMSGTYQAVEMAAKELAEELKIIPFDSGAGSAILGFMCREARLLYQKGFTSADIIKALENIRNRLFITFTLDTLEFAYMNGRISALQSAITSLLKIKPIIMLKDGTLQMSEMVRTRQRSLERVLSLLKEQLDGKLTTIAVVHASAPEAAQSIAEKIKKMMNCREVVITELAYPVVANLGPGTIGIAAFPVNEGIL